MCFLLLLNIGFVSKRDGLEILVRSLSSSASITSMDNICYLLATKIKNIYSAPKLNILY